MSTSERANESEGNRNSPPVVIGLGGNLGDVQARFTGCVSTLAGLGEILAISSLFRTAAVGPPQPDFLNAAVALRPDIDTLSGLLLALQRIELEHGRVRKERWGPRTLDLDILWCSGVVIRSSNLTVPHPELSRRAFALLPLLELFPDATDPMDGQRYRDYLPGLPCNEVERIAQVGWWEASSSPGVDTWLLRW